MDLITPGLGLVFWSIITFLILLLVLKKFAWKPILSAVDERENGIKNALEAADMARREMENLKADNERILNEARAERETMMKEARDIKNKMKNGQRWLNLKTMWLVCLLKLLKRWYVKNWETKTGN